jgi:hypothetical protein
MQPIVWDKTHNQITNEFRIRKEKFVTAIVYFVHDAIIGQLLT